MTDIERWEGYVDKTTEWWILLLKKIQDYKKRMEGDIKWDM